MTNGFGSRDRKRVMVPGLGALALGQIYEDETADYTTGPVTFTLGTESVPVTIPIQSDAHFVCVETTYTNSLAVCAAASTVPVFLNGGATIQITPGKTQKPIQQAPVPISSVAGTEQLPYMWPLPYLFIANAPIIVNLTGAGVVAPSMAGGVIRLTFHGYKVPRGKTGIAELDTL